MKKIGAYQTADGRVHLTRGAAFDHADEALGKAIVGHARELAQIDKYTRVMDYLESHAESLAQLAALKRDRDTVENENEI